MKCVGIIWNCAFEYKDEILKIMSKRCKIERSYCVELGNKYETFLRSIYSHGTIAKWKVDKKIEYMKKYNSSSVCIIHFDIDTSVMRYHEKKKCLVYSNLQDLKDLIRKTYQNKLPFYTFDIVFHCSDTQEEYDADTQIIRLFQ